MSQRIQDQSCTCLLDISLPDNQGEMSYGHRDRPVSASCSWLASEFSSRIDAGRVIVGGKFTSFVQLLAQNIMGVFTREL